MVNNIMIKRIITFSLLMVVFILILAFYPGSTIFLRNGAYSAEAAVRTENSVSLFLSDEYFSEIDALFDKIKKENRHRGIFYGSEKIAAEVVINQMMDDLENNIDALHNHRNFFRYFDSFDKYIRMLDGITERMHFFRNTLNSYSGAPTDLDAIIDLAARGEWHLFSAKFHRFNYEDINGALNVKFISEGGRFEAVYNTGTGKIVTDPANMGTYNFAPGSINPIQFYMHDKYDKKPWKKWGNVNGFSYHDIMDLESGQGPDAEINNKKVEKLIQKRIDDLKKDNTLKLNQ